MARKIRIHRGRALLEQIGHWTFLGGAGLAIVGGLLVRYVDQTALFPWLFFLGLVVGILNITIKETTRFLVAAVALIAAGIVNIGAVPLIGIPVRAALTNIVIFAVPAAVFVALRTIWLLARER